MLGAFKEPKDTDKYSWTKHSIEKMKFYGLSPQRVLRVLRNPERCEAAVAENCEACMKTVEGKKKTEIWVMYRELKSQKSKVESSKLVVNSKHQKIISAWRYPGVSPKGGIVPIPEDILEEINNLV